MGALWEEEIYRTILHTHQHTHCESLQAIRTEIIARMTLNLSCTLYPRRITSESSGKFKFPPIDLIPRRRRLVPYFSLIGIQNPTID